MITLSESLMSLPCLRVERWAYTCSMKGRGVLRVERWAYSMGGKGGRDDLM